MKRRFLLLVTVILAVVLIAGCSSGGKSTAPQPGADYGDSSSGYDDWAEAPAPAPDEGPQQPAGEAEPDGFMPGTSSDKVDALASQMGDKIIKSGYLAVETLDFEETTSAIARRVQQAGGFISSSNVEGWSRSDAKYKPLRHAHYKVRIPSERFEQFITDVGELGNVTKNETWGEDVSAQYFDTEARLQSLTLQEERLLAILAKAEELQYIIELERELATVRYEIENLTGTLRKYDNLVAYSTLEIQVDEVEEITEVEEKPVTLWEKIVRTFQNSIKNVTKVAEGLLLFLIGAVPFLVLIGVILLALYGIVRLFIRKNQKIPFKPEQKEKVKEEEPEKK
jgi:flagellar basal body-associated protein FliL